jgi:hypothetical protein
VAGAGGGEATFEEAALGVRATESYGALELPGGPAQVAFDHRNCARAAGSRW